jgi:hypothetical protein
MNENRHTNEKNADDSNPGSNANDDPALKIKAAAIRCRNGEIVSLPPPNRHHDIRDLMAAQRDLARLIPPSSKDSIRVGMQMIWQTECRKSLSASMG